VESDRPSPKRVPSRPHPRQALREGGDARSAQSFSVNTSYSKGFNLALPVPIEFLVMAALATVFYNVQKRRN
jgi:hypothetical protein